MHKICYFLLASAAFGQTYSWRNVEIVGGGFVPGLVMHPAQQDLMYARTDIGGAYRWDAPSQRWIPLTDWIDKDHGNYTGIESIGLDPNDPSRVYLAGGTYIQSWASNGAIFRSTDQGATFQYTPMPFKMGGNEDGRHAGERLAVDPADGSRLFFGSRNAGLWMSTDFAATWSKVAAFPANASSNNIGLVFVVFDNSGGADGTAPETIYVGASNSSTGLYRSIDGGGSWQSVDGQPTGLLPNHAVLSADGSLYISYGDQPGPNSMTNGAVWKYNSRTTSWTDVTPMQPTSRVGFGYAGLAVDAQNPGTVMVATMDRWSIGDDIFRTIDGGATWTPLKVKSLRDDSASPYITQLQSPSSSIGWWFGNVSIDPFRPDHVLYTTGATIWGTDDATNVDSGNAVHWSPRAGGLEETSALDMISPPAGANLISALGDIGGFRHDDLTISPPQGRFSNPVFSTTNSIDFAELNPSIVVRVGSAGNNTRRGAISTDGGTSWKPFVAEPKGSQGAGYISVSADGSALVWATGGTVSYSSDQGGSWTTSNGISAGTIHVVSDRVNPQKFFALDPNTSRIVMSTDGGATFAARSLPLARDTNPTLRLNPAAEGDLWLAASGGLYHSPDGGTTVTRIASVDSADSFGFGKSATDGGYPALYIIGQVAKLKGIYRSDDAGATWVRINDDQHQYSTSYRIIGDPRIYGRVYLANNGRGVIYGDLLPPSAQPARRNSAALGDVQNRRAR